jgi:AraC-like DNA-binding protein
MTDYLKSPLPLVRLVSAQPVLAELDRRQLPADMALESIGLSRKAMNDPDVFVHAMVMYQFLETAAETAGEKYFVASVGEQLDLTKWYPTIGIAEKALTVGDLLTAWTITATKHSSAIQQRLDVHGASAIVSGHRSFKLNFVPAQVDGFHVGFLVSILRLALKNQWNPSDILITVSDPKALPPIFHGIKALKGNRRGHRIQFPAEWLNQPFDEFDFLRRSLHETEQPKPAKTIVDSITQAIRPHIGKSALTNSQIASLCNMKPRALSRLLTQNQTTLTTLLNDLKRDVAIKEMENTRCSITEIAANLGYSDPTSFARAFKNWTGKSPREYRKLLSKKTNTE